MWKQLQLIWTSKQMVLINFKGAIMIGVDDGSKKAFVPGELTMLLL